MTKSKDTHPTTRPYPNPFFQNYDYVGSVEGTKVSPGSGLFKNLSKFKSVEEFLKAKRKANKQIRQAYYNAIELIKQL